MSGMLNGWPRRWNCRIDPTIYHGPFIVVLNFRIDPKNCHGLLGGEFDFKIKKVHRKLAELQIGLIRMGDRAMANKKSKIENTLRAIDKSASDLRNAEATLLAYGLGTSEATVTLRSLRGAIAAIDKALNDPKVKKSLEQSLRLKQSPVRKQRKGKSITTSKKTRQDLTLIKKKEGVSD